MCFRRKAVGKGAQEIGEAAKAPDLEQAFEKHAEESATQVERLTEIFEIIGKPARAKTFEAMQGLKSEMDEDLEDFGETVAGGAVRGRHSWPLREDETLLR